MNEKLAGTANNDQQAGQPNDDSSPKSAADSSGAGDTANALEYQPQVAGDEQDAEQAFESLYQVLYYRWQPAGPVESGSDG
jgi:hypothetical protein